MKLLDINEFKAMIQESWSHMVDYETTRIDGDVHHCISNITSEKDGITIVSHEHFKFNEEKAKSFRIFPSASLNVRFIGALVIDNNRIVSFEDLAAMLPKSFLTHDYPDYVDMMA